MKKKVDLLMVLLVQCQFKHDFWVGNKETFHLHLQIEVCKHHVVAKNNFAVQRFSNSFEGDNDVVDEGIRNGSFQQYSK